MSIYIRNIFQTHTHCEKVSDHKTVTLLSTRNLLKAVLEFTGRLHSPKTSVLADGRIQETVELPIKRKGKEIFRIL